MDGDKGPEMAVRRALLRIERLCVRHLAPARPEGQPLPALSLDPGWASGLLGI